ncbi:peptidoglycan binding protein CsiV [Vibrio mexicanus]|uniref:peptidoglycan binding protein CsiV n=1 Tax=Vibrio mexicanus TaxID=1004326 RepID=UPI00063CC158|nr:peptidoglycan binding protein CsiV [Vibrio mexicanus]
MKKLIPLLLFFVSLPSMAQRQFDIEVIIFKRAVDAEQTSESWPNTQPEISMERVGQFSDASYRDKKGVTMLPFEEYELGDQVASLKKHAGFNVLMHTAWRQGDQGRFGAPIFHIQAGKDYSENFNPDGTERSLEDAPQALDGIVEESIPSPLYELDGKLQIYVEHYLYADTTLDLKSPSVRKVIMEDAPIDLESNVEDVTEESNVQLGHLEDVTPSVEIERFLKSYRMDQKRRMRSTETHFLDHPLMGMIIQVRRVAQ